MEKLEMIRMKPLESMEYENKTVLLRLDINSPVDRKTKIIVSDNRIIKSLPTLNYLLEKKAKVVIIAHQGDTLDYHNLIPMNEHAKKLALLTGKKIAYTDDVCGPYAVKIIKELNPGEGILLGNLRYLTEEVSTFENEVKLDPIEMKNAWIVRSLASVCDIYVNDAFSAAHRNCPSMTAFQKILPCTAGKLLFGEYNALKNLMTGAKREVVFVLGGAKISDAFSMLNEVLEKEIADKILACGITGQVMILAAGYNLGKTQEDYFRERDLLKFVEPAKTYLDKYRNKIEYPYDLAYEINGVREDVEIKALPSGDVLFMDIGPETAKLYSDIISNAGTVFANGPAGVYEDDKFAQGTKIIIDSIAKTKAYTVIGGGDTVTCAERFSKLEDFNYVCTAGGAMVRFLSGKKLPLIEAMEDAYDRKS